MKISGILKTMAYYSFLGLILQGILFNILFAFSPATGQDLNEIKITFSAVNEPLENIFEKIEQKTEFKFFYIKDELSLKNPVTISSENESLYKVLSRLAREAGLAFKRIDNQIVVKTRTAVMRNTEIIFDGSTLKGKVIDSNNGDPLPGASLQVENTINGTITNENGEFEIYLRNTPAVIQISFVGYKTEHLHIDNTDSELIIHMLPISYMLQEINIFSKPANREITSASIQNEQVKNFAGFTKDALRSVQLLPGVSTNNEGTAFFNVRGGTYDENMVLVNGVEIYSPFHLKAFTPMGVGVFNIDLVKNINFSPGGFSAEYGNSLSSMLNVDYDLGSRNNYSAKLDLSMMDLSGLISGPISSKGSFSLGLRKSYLDVLLRTFAGEDIHADYYDIQSVFNYELNKTDLITATFIYSKDTASQDPSVTNYNNTYNNSYINNQRTQEIVNQDKYHTGEGSYHNTLLAVKYDKQIDTEISSQTIFSFYDEFENEGGITTENIDHDFSNFPDRFVTYSYRNLTNNNLRIRTTTLKQNFQLALSPFYTLKAGFAYRNINYDVNIEKGTDGYYSENLSSYPNAKTIIYPKEPAYNDTLRMNVSTYRGETFVENIFQLSNNMILNAGGRIEYFDMNKQIRFSPRLGLSYNIGNELMLRLSYGLFYQAPTYKQLRFNEATDLNTSYQKAVHYVAGIEKSFFNSITCRLDGYYKQYSDLLKVTRVSNSSLQYRTKENDTEGYATGFDLQIIAKLSPVDIWLSYGYLDAREKLYTESNYSPRYTDQRHTLSSVITLNLGSNWQSSVRCFYGSGYAFTPSTLYYDPNARKYSWIPGEKNSDHYPAYTRIDFRLGKTFDLFDHPLVVYLDIMNIFGKSNILSYRYTFNNYGQPIRQNESLLPTIPTLGISYSF